MRLPVGARREMRGHVGFAKAREGCAYTRAVGLFSQSQIQNSARKIPCHRSTILTVPTNNFVELFEKDLSKEERKQEKVVEETSREKFFVYIDSAGEFEGVIAKFSARSIYSVDADNLPRHEYRKKS